jgi:hypothetical protein
VNAPAGAFAIVMTPLSAPTVQALTYFVGSALRFDRQSFHPSRRVVR